MLLLLLAKDLLGGALGIAIFRVLRIGLKVLQGLAGFGNLVFVADPDRPFFPFLLGVGLDSLRHEPRRKPLRSRSSLIMPA